MAAFSATGGGMSGLSAIVQPDMSSVASFYSPALIVYYLLTGLFGGVILMGMFAPAAVIYRDLFAGRTEDVSA